MDTAMQEDALTLHLDRDMRAFVSRQAKLAVRSGDLVDSEETDLPAAYVERLLCVRRRESWTCALWLLQTTGWAGCEIFAAADVSTRYRLDSEEAEREIESTWTHIPHGRWRRRVVQWQRQPQVALALLAIAHELDSDDPDCRNACLAMYDRPSLWSRLWRRPRSTYAKVKRMGNDSFVAVRLGQ
jgi:hypothetical protein